MSGRGSNYTSGTRGESIYMDAYTGFDEIEEQKQIQTHISEKFGLKPQNTLGNNTDHERA